MNAHVDLSAPNRIDITGDDWKDIEPKEVTKRAVAKYAVAKYFNNALTDIEHKDDKEQSGDRNDLKVVGLGTGSTATWLVKELGILLRQGSSNINRLKFVCTSQDTVTKARAEGLQVVEVQELGTNPSVDLAIDGADEIDPAANIIKGRGGALYREKLIELLAKRFVVIADSSKLVQKLGAGTLPVDIGTWSTNAIMQRVERVCHTLQGPVSMTIRNNQDEEPFRTDDGNYVLDVTFSNGISDPVQLCRELKTINGVIETGLFVQMNPEVFTARQLDSSTVQISQLNY
ncbi:ribose-5-phosphate isomerase A [Gregarina niphandrodes]|uniref:ribose-5-phosphate isomerase n=1 Tax=Gregarina niphandrodes TaxID=110365 RepID=A0A023B5X1_GRENI|nr:ribose-5-phosphate isomerase A [Gregarina niphandrodes]EZG63627.1 ribose-5-phosphate isomerase A [Gregarina niphandrodes]|eukprot:XP_011130667.1 ribose-5-phosphate isomerase A [Gregarina niphandrodes]